MPADVGLSRREETFCRFFIKAKTRVEAVILAGYSAKAPSRQLKRLLRKPEIVKRINELKAKRNERVDLSADDVVLRINHLAVIAQSKGELLTALKCLEVLLKHVTDVTLRERPEMAAAATDKQATKEEAIDNVVELRDAARRAKQARSSEDD